MAELFIIILIAFLGVGALLVIVLINDSIIDERRYVSGADLYRIPYSEGRRLHNRLTRLRRRHRALDKKQEKASSLARGFDAMGMYERVAVLVAEADDAKRRMRLLQQQIEQVEKKKAQEEREREYRILTRRRDDEYRKLTTKGK